MYNLGHYLLSLILFGFVMFLARDDKARISKGVYVQSGALFVVTYFIWLSYVSHYE